MGFRAFVLIFLPIIPQTARDAWSRIRRMNSLKPSRSATEWNITMSLVPTYSLTSLDAIVETMTFGRPKGRERIIDDATEVPVPPPSPMTPLN